MKKSRTAPIEDVEVDFRVLRFTCHDSTFLASIGKHCRELTWLVEVGGTPQPLDVHVMVDKQVMMSPEVHIACNGNQVFPAEKGGATTTPTKAKLREDFAWKWPFRGLIRGIGLREHFEVRPESSVGEHWYLATITEQRDDGYFKATVLMPDFQGGVREVDFPAVHARNVRETFTKAPLVVPQCSLVLWVPVEDPLHATLLVERDYPGSTPELITHFFARSTPRPPKGLGGPPAPEQKVRFQVSKDRRVVTCSLGYHALNHFLSGEVRTVAKETEGKLKRTWVIEVGPFGRHEIHVEKTKEKSKVVTLTVDGEILCESSAEDIDCHEHDRWECPFRLQGQRYLEWQVYETNADGDVQDTVGVVLQRTTYKHQCCVTVGENVAEAKLFIDGREFRDLPDTLEIHKELPLECAPEALLASFGLVAPYKVDPNAPAGLRARAAAAGGSLGASLSLFSCCTSSPVATNEVVFPLPH